MSQNIQLYQTVILSCILFVGVCFFHLDISFFEILITFITVSVLDYLFINNFHLSLKNAIPYSGINTAFGICFFLRSDDMILYIFAGALAISGKHLIQVGGRHFFNPSNMGLFVTLCLFPQYTWVNTLQWGNYSGSISIGYIFMFCSVLFFGFYISTQVKKILHYGYLLNYLLPFIALHSLLFFLIPYYESFSSYILFFNISFFIFVFFMMSDPKTIPHRSASKMLYAIMMVFWFYILQFFINENYALLGSLFLSTCFLPLIWKYEIKKYKGVNIGYLGLIFCNISMMIVIALSLSFYGQPDLVFDNVCNQLICK